MQAVPLPARLTLSQEHTQARVLIRATIHADELTADASIEVGFGDIACGVDGAGNVACVNQHDMVGFVVGPGGTFTSGPSPMLDRPEGANPYFPSLPG